MSSTPKKVSLERRFIVDNLDISEAAGLSGITYEPFQLDFLNDESPLRIDVKSRQVAWSWILAIWGLSCALVKKESTVFVSINLEEAAEKVRYARIAYDVLQTASPLKLPKLVSDNKLGLELDNGTRLLSLPGKAPRGKARFNVGLDEYAHAKYSAEIFTGAMPIISKGGRLRIGSSPMGAQGMFWEIYEQRFRKYPDFKRKLIPWWLTNAFCIDMLAASRDAASMTTEERVLRYGTSRLRLLYNNVPLDTFQQEYECLFLDEVLAWITWDEIRNVQDPELDWLSATGKDANLNPIKEQIERMALACSTGGGQTPVFYAGVDIGRTRHASEIVLLDTTGKLILRAVFTMLNVEFDDQLEILKMVLNTLPVRKMYIDRTGIGRNLAENMEKAYTKVRVEGVDFTSKSKAIMATDVKMLFQQREIVIPADRELMQQIHSVKRRITNTTVSFDADASQTAHADKFWALALAASNAHIAAGKPTFNTAVEKPVIVTAHTQIALPRLPVAVMGGSGMMRSLPPTIGI